MFDIDFEKILVFGIVALVVIPAKDLPRVLRTVGQTIGKLRKMASEFQGQFMDALKEADLDSVKREIAAIHDSAKVDVHFDPVADIKRETETALAMPVEPATGSILPPQAAPIEPPAAEAPVAAAPVAAAIEPKTGPAP